MSDKIGVLGESTTASLGTATPYTVPAGKGAKFRIMFVAQGNAAGGTVIAIAVNGMTIATIAAMTANFYVFSIKGAGLRAAEQAALPIGTTAALTVAPADPIYYANVGDTVTYTISGAAAISMNFQVVGVEVDV